MKRSVKMIALLTVLAALFAGKYAVEKFTATTTVTEEAGTFALTNYAADELTGLSWSDGEAQYRFVKTDDAWSNADDASFPTDSEAVQALADDVTALEGTRTLENVESLSDYGLDEPSFTLDVEWSDGSTTRFSMGDATPFEDGYYLRLDDETGKIYTIGSSLSRIFDVELTNLALLEEMPEVENVTRLTVGETLDLEKRERSETVDPEQLWYNRATGEAVQSDSVQNLIDAAQAISWSELLTATASEEELAEWQLDDAATVLTLYDGDEAALTLCIGATNENGDYYARLEDSKMAYTVSADSVSALMSADADALWVADLLPLAFENLDAAQLTAGDAQWSIVRTEVEVPAEREETSEETAEETSEETSGETDETTVEVQVAVNGEAAELSQVEDLWGQIVSLTATEKLEAQPEGEALLSVRASNVQGAEETVTFYAYDVDSYLAEYADGRRMLVSADAVDKILRTVKALG